MTISANSSQLTRRQLIDMGHEEPYDPAELRELRAVARDRNLLARFAGHRTTEIMKQLIDEGLLQLDENQLRTIAEKAASEALDIQGLVELNAEDWPYPGQSPHSMYKAYTRWIDGSGFGEHKIAEKGITIKEYIGKVAAEMEDANE